MVPSQQLPGGSDVAASIQLPEQSRAGQPPRTQVEAEVHQRVELPLGQLHADQPANLPLRLQHVVCQDRGGQLLADSVRKRLPRRDPVSIADGWETGYVGIWMTAKPLRPLNQFQPCRAQLHEKLLCYARNAKGPASNPPVERRGSRQTLKTTLAGSRN